MRNLLCVPGTEAHPVLAQFPGVSFQGWHAPVPSYGLGATVTAQQCLQHMPGMWREGGRLEVFQVQLNCPQTGAPSVLLICVSACYRSLTTEYFYSQVCCQVKLLWVFRSFLVMLCLLAPGKTWMEGGKPAVPELPLCARHHSRTDTQVIPHILHH